MGNTYESEEWLQPEMLQSRWMRYMRSGDWAAAWRISDEALRRRRLSELSPGQCGPVPTLAPRHLQSIWTGEPLSGKTVLVHCYHGLGDTIQFIRFLPLLRTIAARTIVWAQPPLLPLIASVGGIDLLLPLHEGAPGIDRDVDIELMELPHALRVKPEDVGRLVPYLHVSGRSRSAGQTGIVQGAGPAPAVGVVWRAGPWDTRRSIEPALIRRLMSVGGFDWLIFQRGDADVDELADIARIPDINNILEEARALRQLNLLISVDTLSAHLGGALGIPTWTLLPQQADWRWQQGKTTPWYPTMTLFRQPAAGDWNSVIDSVLDRLKCWTQPEPNVADQ